MFCVIQRHIMAQTSKTSRTTTIGLHTTVISISNATHTGGDRVLSEIREMRWCRIAYVTVVTSDYEVPYGTGCEHVLPSVLPYRTSTVPRKAPYVDVLTYT